MDVESDPAERYPLLTSAEWAAHSTFQSETLPADSALFSLPYYSEVDVAPRPQLQKCGGNTATTPGAILNGYAGASINGSTEAQMLAACIARCCAEGDKCAAVTLQSMSLNSGDPIGDCQPGKPCCWLIAPDQAMHPPEPGHPHATSAILRSPPPSGPYAPILREMDAIIARHLASMTRGTIPGGKGIPRPTQTLNYPGVV